MSDLFPFVTAIVGWLFGYFTAVYVLGKEVQKRMT